MQEFYRPFVARWLSPTVSWMNWLSEIRPSLYSSRQSCLVPLRCETLESRRLLAGVVTGAVFDVNGAPLSDVGVFLDANNDGVAQADELIVQTDLGGEFEFVDVESGSHFVRLVLPADYRQLSPQDPSRLFAFASNSDEIVELNPLTGTVVNRLARPGVATAAAGLAFDGSHLFVVDSTSDTIHQLAPLTGAVVDTHALPTGNYDGIASLSDGLLYVSDFARNEVLALETSTWSVVRVLDLGGLNLQGGLGESANREHLLVLTNTADIVEVDPETGVVLSSFSHEQARLDAAVAGFGGEVFVGFGAVNESIRVFDSAGQIRRELNPGMSVFGLAGIDGRGDAAVGTSLGRSSQCRLVYGCVHVGKSRRTCIRGLQREWRSGCWRASISKQHGLP